MPNVYIGTSGYLYNHWYGVFYPEGLTKNEWLEYYTRFFDTVELNVTFYRLPQETAFKNWHKRTPKDFLFTIKGWRFITHIKKLGDIKEALGLFFARAKILKEKLATVLWQFPPNFKADPQKLENFCKLIKKYNVRQSFEFRDESWFCEDIYQILEKHNYALVICDYPFELVTNKIKKTKRRLIKVPETADFIYLRRHGATALYSSNYSNNQLKEDADQIKKWLKEKRDVYVYFNNDAHGFAVKNAQTLKKMV